MAFGSSIATCQETSVSLGLTYIHTYGSIRDCTLQVGCHWSIGKYIGKSLFSVGHSVTLKLSRVACIE